MKLVDEQLGAVARPARVRFVTLLPKTRSGKLLRRASRPSAKAATPAT
jgi:propionyl-CoA synthetase